MGKVFGMVTSTPEIGYIGIVIVVVWCLVKASLFVGTLLTVVPYVVVIVSNNLCVVMMVVVRVLEFLDKNVCNVIAIDL